jgi:hypothetical protein
MSAEQVGQLYELMHATKDVWKSEAELIQSSSENTAELTDATHASPSKSHKTQ